MKKYLKLNEMLDDLVDMDEFPMCTGLNCPSKESCYRYRARPKPVHQVWGDYHNLRTGDKCGYYWPVE